jgi:hypothetical protein
MEIKGYTLHGDYYLADKVILNKNWKEACKTREEIILPNGKMVVAHTLSLEELRTIPREERGIGHELYWTSTSDRKNNNSAWGMDYCGHYYNNINKGRFFSVRLGFKNPF